MSDNAALIRTWIMKSPRPAALRVYARDGREFDIPIKPGQAWLDTAVSIAALEPERIEALSEDETLLRATVVADLFKKAEAQERHEASAEIAMQATDPETQRIIVFAKLLERAHDRSTTAIENTVNVAFTKLQEICGSLAEQAQAAQQSANDLAVGIRSLLIQQAQEAATAAATPESSPLERMAESFMSGQALKGATEPAAAANGAKPNGKKH
ncbi:MAG TPA: hypothetical protein VNO55_31600 [Polyangia bacterium]|nr:hypothetical protein [Polyangia bacterium]